MGSVDWFLGNRELKPSLFFFFFEKTQNISCRHGFVVVKNVLTSEEVEESVSEIWKEITERCEGKAHRDDPESWNNWPSGLLPIVGMFA